MKMVQFTLKSMEKLVHLLGKVFGTVFYLKTKIMSERFRLNTDVTAEGLKYLVNWLIVFK